MRHISGPPVVLQAGYPEDVQRHDTMQGLEQNEGRSMTEEFDRSVTIMVPERTETDVKAPPSEPGDEEQRH